MDAKKIMAATKVLSREDLDRLKCAMPGCTHEDDSEFYAHAKCHLGAKVFYVPNIDATLDEIQQLSTATTVCYFNVKLLVTCSICDKPILLVEVK